LFKQKYIQKIIIFLPLNSNHIKMGFKYIFKNKKF